MAVSLSSNTSNERENKRIAFTITSVLFIALLMICFLWIIMVIPDPLPSEIAEGGVEVSYGYDAQGSGDIESLAPANNRPPNPNAKAGSPPVDPKPVQESSPASSPKAASSKADDESVVTTDDPDSKEEVKTRPEPKKEAPKKNTEVEKPIKKTVETTKPVTTAPVAPKVEEKPKVDQRALFKKTDKPGAGGTGNGTSNQTAGNNNGDDNGKTGDKGDPRGIMGSKNYSGKPGTGGGDAGGDGDGSGSGISARITGWNARISQPNPDDLSSDGFVIFKVTIDEDGRVDHVTVVQATLPPQDVALCKTYVQKGKYTAKEGNEGGGVGTVKFTIKSR